jgi:hypothetical protein
VAESRVCVVVEREWGGGREEKGAAMLKSWSSLYEMGGKNSQEG